MDESQGAGGGFRYFWALAFFSALLLLSPIRKGDLAGYDDAMYAHIAKNIVRSGDWLNLTSNGHPVLEHPPLLVWMQATLFSVFGFRDALAKLPVALSGLGTILLVYWLAHRLLRDRLQATLSMFVMATTIYFLKYSARAMTDVLCTFLFIGSVCAWTKVEEDRRWYLVTGFCVGLALMSRGMIGLALPVIFALDLSLKRSRPPVGFAMAALVLAFLPLAFWYWHTIAANRSTFAGVHSTWLRNEVFGELNPPWRRYTGIPEYLWMLSKSYWPWLPAMVAGLVIVIRGGDRKRWILVVWIGVVFVLCSATRSRVLRYMLPAYPAFSILAAIGLMRFVSERVLRGALRILMPVFGIVAILVALFPPVILHAAAIRPVAAVATGAAPPGTRVALYDKGDPRFDEANQLQWYGGRNLVLLFAPGELAEELRLPSTKVFIVDRASFQRLVYRRYPCQVLIESGDLVCFRLLPLD